MIHEEAWELEKKQISETIAKLVVIGDVFGTIDRTTLEKPVYENYYKIGIHLSAMFNQLVEALKSGAETC